MRASATALGVLTAVLAAGPAAAQPGQGPPPFAFRSATLERAVHRIDVRMQAVQVAHVRVTVRRHGRRLTRATGTVEIGRSVVSLPLGPRSVARLRPGQHVDLTIEYGAPQPVLIYDAVLHRSARHPAGGDGSGLVA